MGNQLVSSVTTVALAIVSLAILAVIVSKKANTATVITSSGNAFASALSAAEAPVSGSYSSYNSAGYY
jgi:PRD1 phage membrane DNA delivery